MQSKTNPTLLEIACAFRHWSEYLAVDGPLEDHELAETDPAIKLAQMQESGFFESYRGYLYDRNGELMTENEVLVEIESASCDNGEAPTIWVGEMVHRTLDFRITSDTLTGPGGWYVIVRGTEGGEE